MISPEQVSTPEQLRTWLKERGEEWFTVGWAGDPEVYETDGTGRFHQMDNGTVELRSSSRGTATGSMRFPDLRTAVQAEVNRYLAGDLGSRVSSTGLREHVSVRGIPESLEVGPPREGQWAVVVSEGSFHAGGMTMGRFRHYASATNIDETVELLERLVSTSGPSEPAPEGDLIAAGGATSQRILQRVDAEGGYARPTGVGPGDLLERVGHESGSQLFALGTPFAWRSQPPDMVGAEYHRYRVLAELPEAQEGRAAAWFDQPGGGAMIVAERPVRWYLDQGYLLEITDPA